MPSLDFPSLTAYMYFPTSAPGCFPLLMYFRTSRLVCLILHGAILVLLESTSITCINFISALNALPTAIVLCLLIIMDRVRRKFFKVLLLVPCQLVLLEPFDVLSGTIWCDNLWNKLWSGSAPESLNIIFFCSVDFVLVGFALLTWRVDFSAVSLSFLCLISDPVTFVMNR